MNADSSTFSMKKQGRLHYLVLIESTSCFLNILLIYKPKPNGEQSKPFWRSDVCLFASASSGKWTKFLRRGKWKCTQAVNCAVVGLCFCDWGETSFSSFSTSSATLFLLYPPLQDHNSSLTSQFLPDGAGPDPAFLTSLPSWWLSAFPPAFPLTSLPSLDSLKAPFVPLFSLQLILFSLLPFAQSFPVTAFLLWLPVYLLPFTSFSQTHTQKLALTPAVWTVSLTSCHSFLCQIWGLCKPVTDCIDVWLQS